MWDAFFKMLPDLFQFYGPYIQTTLFHSYPGSLNYLSYMRQIGAQDPIQVAICLPESEFPQKDYLPMIVTLKAELEDFGSKLKNLFSFYKESDTAIDRINYPSTKPRGPVVRCWRFCTTWLTQRLRAMSVFSSFLNQRGIRGLRRESAIFPGHGAVSSR
ncbi:hypothetical protein ASPWEDRAFT_186700 [Aspergillus wentii DTO 134E9]|uniref:Uncharacterized protein n=1 Tax=Aspergillus wentii DTO 134E9 TaxID=1073089 RepID=A0A1L9RC89_ASPWE|nr:uncharacterized protein ASPWEDRAFT_186700 [Aspergillus wentii DTO 134E9]OJJ32536.1 hypothetical protein ASPWEDRAFT_186700 [Aspergillus wentii DTO 134E9]